MPVVSAGRTGLGKSLLGAGLVARRTFSVYWAKGDPYSRRVYAKVCRKQWGPDDGSMLAQGVVVNTESRNAAKKDRMMPVVPDMVMTWLRRFWVARWTARSIGASFLSASSWWFRNAQRDSGLWLAVAAVAMAAVVKPPWSDSPRVMSPSACTLRGMLIHVCVICCIAGLAYWRFALEALGWRSGPVAGTAWCA